MRSTLSVKKDLTYPVQYVKGIGPKRAAALSEQGIKTVRDLLYYFPFAYIDLSKTMKIVNLRSVMDTGKWVTVIGRVQTFDIVGKPPKQRFILVLGDDSGVVQLIFFRSVSFFRGAFTKGELLAVSGKVTGFNNRPQIVHPSIDRLSGSDDDEEGGGDLHGFLHTKGIVPKYGSSEELRGVNLHVKGLRRIMRATLDEFIDCVEEVLPEEMRSREKLIPIRQALTSIHFPESGEALEEARRRLKYDELFFMQLLLALRRKSVKVDLPGIPFKTQSSLARKLLDSLPFSLTEAQRRVMKEIAADMQSTRPMNRLLQGDVGSGKTIVALAAMLVAIDNGYQAAFMAPTEILAEQHFRTIETFLKNLPVNVRFLIGGQRSRLRRDVLEDISRGSAQLVVGTHALIQEQVQFANLGFVVVDEQHRFGVAQRIALREKGLSREQGSPFPDILVMTATPIPRTLSLTIYGDLDVSMIDELPAWRKPIITGMRTESQIGKVYEFLRQQIRDGRQVYVVYPLVEESEKLDLKAATERYEYLKNEVFPDLKVGLIHGRMAPDEKDGAMQEFKEKKIDVLVATTVIEVGIDIPNATVMVIEHAERFGLSQLHQLRGRVGRGGEQSYCILIVPDWLGRRIKGASTVPTLIGELDEQRNAERRIKTMLDTTDGFKIAEIDLELRGPGDFFGTRQSGLPELQIANLMTDGPILSVARQEAFNIIERDPHLRLPEHGPVRGYFEERLRDAMNLIQGG